VKNIFSGVQDETGCWQDSYIHIDNIFTTMVYLSERRGNRYWLHDISVQIL